MTTRKIDIAAADIDHFRPYLGQNFQIVTPSATIDVVLARCEAKQAARPSGGGVQFSLIFSGPAESAFTSGTYLLHHPDVGDLELFIVTIGPEPHDRQVMRYQVMFA